MFQWWAFPLGRPNLWKSGYLVLPRGVSNITVCTVLLQLQLCKRASVFKFKISVCFFVFFLFFCAEAVLVSLQWLARYYVSIKGKYSMWLLVGRPCIQFGFGCVQKLWLVYCCVCVMSVDGSLFPKQGSDRMHNGFWMDARVYWYLFRTSVWGICILFYFLF